MALTNAEKVRENKARRMAERQGLVLRKSGRRDPRSIGFDRWQVEDEDGELVAGANGRGRPTMTLDEIEAYLNKGGEE